MQDLGIIGQFGKKLILLGMVTLLIACEGIVDAVKGNETAQILGLVLDQPCTLTSREGRRLAGAYLRRPIIAPLGFDLLFINGRESRAGLPRSLIIDDTALRRLKDRNEDDTLTGSHRSTATLHAGFAPESTLPNVYALAYRANKIEYTGPLVVGPTMAEFEIPTSGSQTFAGRIDVSLFTQSPDGSPLSATSTGTFEMSTGYGEKRAHFTVSGLGADLPFESLSWTNLYQCGARLVSSGEGRVTTKSESNAATPPFQTDQTPVPLNSMFESSLFAPATRPALPEKVGGTFVIQSDVGTITGVFLSDVAGT
ncbi:MAG: hypothetical protein OSA51_05010 [Octadecabacter sp.]|nr:hypothetical protein [Octadecabacter sp.]